MDIRTQDGWACGRLLLTSRSEEGLLGVAALTAELMAVHIEQALELAHLREVNGGMRLALAHARDIGMVIGLSWAGTAEAQTAASCLLDKLEQQAVTEPRALHERDDYRFCATPGARLRVVPGDRRGR